VARGAGRVGAWLGCVVRAQRACRHAPTHHVCCCCCCCCVVRTPFSSHTHTEQVHQRVLC
jgi:hypothetical protein